MRAYGICYDTGFLNKGNSTHEPFDPDRVRRDLRVISDDLRCTAVRITGGDVDRLKVAATHAAVAGLETWICPFTTDLTGDELLVLLAECADHGERLRRGGSEVVIVTGSELSLMNKGFVPGETFIERGKVLAAPGHPLRELLAALPARMNELLARAVAVVRGRFGGKISYASLPFEGVDWTPFDYISTDTGYRYAQIADRFPELIRAFVAQGKAQGKPVAITEFGCATYRGAADAGPRGGDIVVWNEATATPLELNGEYVRDEAEQATTLRELLETFDAEGVDTTFVHAFASYVLRHDPDEPRRDLDLASTGVVKVLEDGTWKPKEAFSMLADYHGRRRSSEETS
ncbi:hypothetical protein SOCE26_010020 [Sorangium cellulosum]|uniref:Abortive infection protein n=1 Tax=Sorangium cellulosum TaxID=56 RepID=A0A2L0EK00_SORCE|nr:hypothetical protein [Sorangium cellulosum]AUX39608.1 hypothetical protein SOCE26_010020 [Sorangium cellulosum]